MTLSAEKFKSELGSHPLLMSAAASLEASANTRSPYRRRQETHNASVILEEAAVNAILYNDLPNFHTARTLAAIAPVYGFRRYFADHSEDTRYTEAFAELHLEPSQQAVRKTERATMDSVAALDNTIRSEKAVTPNIIANQGRIQRLRHVLSFQALLLQHLDPSTPQKFSDITLPDFRRKK